MVHNPEKLETATYYRKQGFSYSEIATLCEVSKSTVSNWFKDKAFSKKVAATNATKAAKANKARIALLNKAKQKEREKRYQEAERSAVVEYRHYKKDPLFAAGVILYKSKGDLSDSSQLRLSTSDTTSHKIFITFLTRYTDVSRKDIKFWLLLTPSCKEKECVAVWSKALKLTPGNFYKNQTLSGAAPTKALHYGVGNTIIGNTLLKKKLILWVELLSKELSK